MTEIARLRCAGIRDDLRAVRPLPMCQDCERWRVAADAERNYTSPRIEIIHTADGRVITCTRRIPAN